MMVNKSRPSIPEKVKIQVWTEAAGRCQFRGCNKPLWFNELTLNQTNFSELAHIIGASNIGPRGGNQSALLVKDPSNIMLVCARCHKEIDDSILSLKYNEAELLSMKKEHIERIRFLLDQPSKRTRPLILNCHFGKTNTLISERSILNAILPDYPDKPAPEWYNVKFKLANRTKKIEWDYAFDLIEKEIEVVNRSIANGGLQHLSIFGLAPQPILMYLGMLLGNKIPIKVFEPKRMSDQDNMWNWEQEDGINIQYSTEKILSGSSKDVILLIALSDYIDEDKYKALNLNEASIYKIFIDTPVQGFLKKESDKFGFISECRHLLNLIQSEVGNECKIHVLPAMPASLAVEFGRLIQPTKDPEIIVYEYIPNSNPLKILKLNE
jgi:hypothetical protein